MSKMLFVLFAIVIMAGALTACYNKPPSEQASPTVAAAN